MESFSRITLADVPCLQFEPTQTEPAGNVLLYHGWASTIDRYVFFASQIACWGYRVIVPELPHHGQRGTLDYGDRQALVQHFWSIVRQAAAEAQAIARIAGSSLDTARTVPLAIIGHSTGGFIASSAFARAAAVQTAIVINGSCAWVRCEELFREMFGMPAMTPAEREALTADDPLTHLIEWEAGRGLLLLHGQADATVPIESQRYFMQTLSHRGIPEDQLQFIEHPNVNHHITLAMLEQSKAWLDRHLSSA